MANGPWVDDGIKVNLVENFNFKQKPTSNHIEQFCKVFVNGAKCA